MSKLHHFILGLLLTPNMGFAKPQDIVLKKQTISTQQMEQLCYLLPQQCRDKPVWKLYKTAQQRYYLIDHLKFYQLGFANNKLHIEKRWDFSNYQPKIQTARWAVSDSTLKNEDQHLYIFPKLFPVNEQDYALGIVQTWSEGYSGGGLQEEVVDFLQLKNNGQYQQVFQNIPLSMYRMIRACFSEQQYKESQGKCHDEYSLDTQIAYIKPYTWQIKYDYQADFSPASDTGTKPIREHKNYVLKENRQDAILLPKAWD